MAIIKGMARFPMVHAQDVSNEPDFGLGKWEDICGEVGREWWGGVGIEGGTMPVSWKWKEKYRET